MLFRSAEYVLKMLPHDTHDHDRFIRPAELARLARDAGLALHCISGLTYHPLTRRYALSSDTDVNYLVACRKPAA